MNASRSSFVLTSPMLVDLSVLDGDDGHVARGAVFRDDRDEGDEYDHGQQHDREELDARSL